MSFQKIARFFWRGLPLYLALALGRMAARFLRLFPRRLSPVGHWRPGISMVIPERCTPALLEECLSSAFLAAAQLDEPVEMIVVVNGTSLDNYAHLQERFPGVIWIHSQQALGFQSAIKQGIRRGSYDWVYLLNSDMKLDREALKEIIIWRAPHVFAIASQIFFADPKRRREETGWTGFRIAEGRVELFDITPVDQRTVRGHLYAGGGASLFRRDLLAQMMTVPDPYHPFYWEDVEWGARAWRSGYEVLFCPRSKAIHVHRATVNQLFDASEVDRIVYRNSLQFDLRNRVTDMRSHWPVLRILDLDRATRADLLSLRNAFSVFLANWWNGQALHVDVSLEYTTRKFYLRPAACPSKQRTLLVVAPFAVYPPAHGGARRIAALLGHLSSEFNIVFLGDEEGLYSSDAAGRAAGPSVIHLIGGRPDESGRPQDRIRRVQTHSHALLTREIQRLAAVYEADLVQIEHMELAGTIGARRQGTPWFLTLHDVPFRGNTQPPQDRFEDDLIGRFSGVMVCSEEDRALVVCSKTALVPNGAELASVFRPSVGNRTILFAGPFRYAPNLLGIRTFLESVYPELLRDIPNLRLVILGGTGAQNLVERLECFNQPGVQIHSHVDDVKPWYEDCALSINPLYGIRGSSIKVMESLAGGRVCVSTVEGARGLHHLAFPSLVQVARIEDFIDPILRLLLNESERLRLEKPPEEVRALLDWKRSAEMQSAVYRAYP